MSYERVIIAKVIEDIDHRKVFLPALQRKFVWKRQKIELLFDSLMRNYPFGTFLFWKLHKQNAENYVFYEFLTDYDERNPYNKRKTGCFSHDEIIGVLDGQQRLSSLYIGLMGTHTEKAPYLHRANPAAYEQTSLYLNLLSLPYEITENNTIAELEDRNFEFRFLTVNDAKNSIKRRVTAPGGDSFREESMFWIKVGDVLRWEREPEFDQIIETYANGCQSEAVKMALYDNKRFVKRCLNTLHQRVCKDYLINYFEVAKDELEDILKIFVRVNSGGTVLNKTDLLFSTIVATWDDGRDEIEKLLKKINAKGEGFSFGNEFLMRCCLVLSDGPVVYKVNSFRAENVQRIRDEWQNIAKAVDKTVDLLVEFGFSADLLTSQNATIIIAYYLFKGGCLCPDSKKALQKYLIHALLNRIYNNSQDQLFSDLRNAFRVENKDADVRFTGRFTNITFQDVLNIKLPQQKTLNITESDLNRYLTAIKGPVSFFVLTLLYPDLRYEDKLFHQDHIHPFSGFTDEKLAEMNIPKEDWSKWYERRDRVSNLQLLSGHRNVSKNDLPLADWFKKMEKAQQDAFLRENYFPEKVGLGFDSFINFTDKRNERLREELKKVLSIVQENQVKSIDNGMWIRNEDEAEADA